MTYYINNNNSYIKLPSRFHKLRMFFLSKEEKAKLKLITEDYEIFEKTIKETIPPPPVKNYYFVFSIMSSFDLPYNFNEIVTPKYGGIIYKAPIGELFRLSPMINTSCDEPYPEDFSALLKRIPVHKHQQFRDMCNLTKNNTKYLTFRATAWVEKVPYYKLYMHVADYLRQRVQFSFGTMDSFSKKVFKKMAMRDYPNKYNLDSLGICENPKEMYDSLFKGYACYDMYDFKFGRNRSDIKARVCLGQTIERFFNMLEEEIV